MKYFQILEYINAPPQHFKILDFSNGKWVGHFSSPNRHYDIYMIEDDDGGISYGAIADDDLKNPHGFLTFEKMSNNKYLFSRNAWTDPAYQGRGIQSGLFAFVNGAENKSIFSDAQMSDAGEALWNSLAKSGKFTIKIANINTGETFDTTDIGSIANDGTAVIDPKHDNKSDTDIWRDSESGQRYFYLMEETQYYPLMEGVEPRKKWYAGDRHKKKGWWVAGYFNDGDL